MFDVRVTNVVDRDGLVKGHDPLSCARNGLVVEALLRAELGHLQRELEWTEFGRLEVIR